MITKKVVVYLACIFLFSSGAFAFELQPGAVFDRAVVSDSESSSVSIRLSGPEDDAAGSRDTGGWGGFGGPMIEYLAIDLGPLDPMSDDRGIDGFDDGMLLIGGIGGVIHEDFRFGGFGMGNMQEVSGEVINSRRSAEMSFGGGGVFVELNHALSPNFGVAAGAMLGAGSISLKASGADLGPKRKWDAESSFFMAYPYVGAWVAPVSFMWIELDAGYLFFDMDASGSDFENDLGVDMVDGSLEGDFQAALKINFGYDPNQ